jgi:cAMP-dependent protein kinase regulator
MYNDKGADTIKGKADFVCWKLDRDTFNHIVKDATAKKRKVVENYFF